MYELILEGCTPEPLMNYLKALGVLRLVSEQADLEARGCWRNDVFVLRSKLEHDALLDFFLNCYRPTPIVAPWGARSGFYAGSSEKAARAALDAVMESTDLRFAPFRDLVGGVRSLLRDMGITAKAKDEEKLALLAACRSRLPDEITPWLDTCYVVLGDERRFPPLLGTGGNEGSGSYVSGFTQQVVSCLIKHNHDSALRSALFADSHPKSFTDQTPGHFSGLAAGGANAGQGFAAQVRTNPWDYLLCLEGTCLWASGVVRRLGESRARVAAFPFTVKVSSVGSGSLALPDGVKPKKAKHDIAEIWLPVWPRWLSLPELRGLLAEGRATVGRRVAAGGLDMARAVASLGVDRGVAQFRRNIFLMRNGQSFLAVPFGAVDVKQRDGVDLIREIDSWLDRFRIACNQDAPPRLRTVLRGIERAIFDFCRYGGPQFFQAILVVLGRAERELAVSEQFRDKNGLRPVSGLTKKWVAAANDGTPEFELALALTGIFDQEHKIGPLRANLEPINVGTGRAGRLGAQWAEKDRAVVWNSANLLINLAQVLSRRMMDGERKSCEFLPLASKNFVSLRSVSRFLAGELDDRRIEDLLWGLMLVEPKFDLAVCPAGEGKGPPLPRAYALLKLLFLPEPLQLDGRDVRIKAQPEIVTLLTSHRVGHACRIAARRLRASGLAPLPYPPGGGKLRDDAWLELDHMEIDGERLAAALLLPINRASTAELYRLVIRKSETEGQTL